MYGRQHEIEQSCNVELVVVAEEVARDDSDDVDGIDAGPAIDGLEDALESRLDKDEIGESIVDVSLVGEPDFASGNEET